MSAVGTTLPERRPPSHNLPQLSSPSSQSIRSSTSSVSSRGRAEEKMYSPFNSTPFSERDYKSSPHYTTSSANASYARRESHGSNVDVSTIHSSSSSSSRDQIRGSASPSKYGKSGSRPLPQKKLFYDDKNNASKSRASNTNSQSQRELFSEGIFAELGSNKNEYFAEKEVTGRVPFDEDSINDMFNWTQDDHQMGPSTSNGRSDTGEMIYDNTDMYGSIQTPRSNSIGAGSSTMDISNTTLRENTNEPYGIERDDMFIPVRAAAFDAVLDSCIHDAILTTLENSKKKMQEENRGNLGHSNQVLQQQQQQNQEWAKLNLIVDRASYETQISRTDTVSTRNSSVSTQSRGTTSSHASVTASPGSSHAPPTFKLPNLPKSSSSSRPIISTPTPTATSSSDMHDSTTHTPVSDDFSVQPIPIVSRIPSSRKITGTQEVKSWTKNKLISRTVRKFTNRTQVMSN